MHLRSTHEWMLLAGRSSSQADALFARYWGKYWMMKSSSIALLAQQARRKSLSHTVGLCPRNIWQCSTVHGSASGTRSVESFHERLGDTNV